MASYTTTPDENGTVTVRTRWSESAVTFHRFATQAEAQAWIDRQIGMEEDADRLEQCTPRNLRL